MMLFSGFDLDHVQIATLQQWVEQLAVNYGVEFVPGRQAHLTIHYFGKDITPEQRDTIIVPVYTDLIQSSGITPFDVGIQPTAKLFGKEEDLVVLALNIPASARAFAEKARFLIMQADASIRPPDFMVFEPHLTLGTLKESDPAKRQAFLQHLQHSLTEVESTLNNYASYVDRVILFSNPPIGSSEYTHDTELMF